MGVGSPPVGVEAWLGEVAPLAMSAPQLLERTVRIEEELKAQRDLMLAQFQASDRRFEDVNKCFNSLQWSLGGLFVLLTTLISIYQFVA